jgi:hypothetical protein
MVLSMMIFVMCLVNVIVVIRSGNMLVVTCLDKVFL